MRDVAKAYALAVRQFRRLEPGIILNIASGVPRRIGDILDALLAQSRAKITIEQDLHTFVRVTCRALLATPAAPANFWAGGRNAPSGIRFLLFWLIGVRDVALIFLDVM